MKITMNPVPDFQEKMRILVTGGAGFLGSKLCEKLIENKDEVFCIDNLYTGSINNLDRIIKNEKFHFIEHNIIEPFDIELYIEKNKKIDMIYNLACPASPKKYQKDPIMTLKTCFIGAMNMLELAKKYNAKILQTSTSEIYGAPLEHPQNEKYRGNVNPIGIRACYDEGKRLLLNKIIKKFGENLLQRKFAVWDWHLNQILMI